MPQRDSNQPPALRRCARKAWSLIGEEVGGEQVRLLVIELTYEYPVPASINSTAQIAC